MSQIQPTPGTPKEIMRGIRIFFIAIIAGAVFFAVVGLFIHQYNGLLAPEAKEYEKIFLTIAAVIGLVCLVAALNGYTKGIAAAREPHSLKDKLNQYRVVLIRFIALCEGPALFGIIMFIITGNYNFFIVTAVMLAAMLSKAPTRKRVAEDLALDWNQQKELE